MNKCIFLDRDGVLNKDYVDYAYTPEKFIIIDGVKESIDLLKKAGYLVVVITNQSGIAKGIYTREQMHECHRILQHHVDHQIDKFYYAPFHESVSNSLSRKPGSLMFERAIARFDVDVSQSWMVGDKERDIVPAIKMGLKTVQVDGHNCGLAHYVEENLLAATRRILEVDFRS